MLTLHAAGSFATCYRAKLVRQTCAWTRASSLGAVPPNGETVVAKKIERTHRAFKYDAVVREVRVMRALAHKSIIDVLDYCEDASGKSQWVEGD